MKLVRRPVLASLFFLHGCFDPGAQIPSSTSTETGDATDSAQGSGDTNGSTLADPTHGPQTSDTGPAGDTTTGPADDTGGCIPDGRDEICDGVDNDCDGIVDPPGAEGCIPSYADADADGYGDDRLEACLCATTDEYPTSVGGDCDDGDPTMNPGASEACNGVDDDCSGQIDEPWPSIGSSCDGDDPDACEDGTIVCSADGADAVCNDEPETTNGQELCNGADDDCNGTPDDPWAAQLGTPCDGGDADQCANGVYVCNGDGSGMLCAGDMNITEICNGMDDDCDGQLDEGCDDDGDDYCDAGMTVVGNPAVCDPALGEDCNDTNPAINPGADEICNGIDDDCDGQIDAADPDTSWSGNDAYEPNALYFAAPEIFENADPAVPFGPSPTWFGGATDGDFFFWDDSFPSGIAPPFMMCHISGMTAPMRVDMRIGYRRPGDPAFPFLHDDIICPGMANGDTCVLQIASLFSTSEYQLITGVDPDMGVDQCNDDYVLECRLDYTNVW